MKTLMLPCRVISMQCFQKSQFDEQAGVVMNKVRDQ